MKCCDSNPFFACQNQLNNNNTCKDIFSFINDLNIENLSCQLTQQSNKMYPQNRSGLVFEDPNNLEAFQPLRPHVRTNPLDGQYGEETPLQRPRPPEKHINKCREEANYSNKLNNRSDVKSLCTSI